MHGKIFQGSPPFLPGLLQTIQRGKSVPYLIALGLVLPLTAAGGTHGGTANVAGRGLGGMSCRGSLWARTWNVTVKVGQPASTDSLVANGSLKSGCG